jgi:hypothetical protein
MPGDCRKANRVRWAGHRRRVTVQACEAVKVRDVLDALRGDLHAGEVREAATGLTVEVCDADRVFLGSDRQATGVAWSGLPNGGRRGWLLCSRCGRRASKLYVPPPGLADFACRACHGLTYASRQRWNPRWQGTGLLARTLALLATVERLGRRK